MNLLGLADRLHKTLDEIKNITFEEYYTWLVYFKIKESERGSQTKRTNNPNRKR